MSLGYRDDVNNRPDLRLLRKKGGFPLSLIVSLASRLASSIKADCFWHVSTGSIH